MTGWSCSASLCFNSHRKPGVRYYRLPRDPVIQQQYKKILKTDGVNWFRGYICAEHWSTGEKVDNQLPDIAAPPSQIPLFEKKLETVKKRIRRSSNPSINDKNRLKELQKKLTTIKSLNNLTPSTSSSPFLFSPPPPRQRQATNDNDQQTPTSSFLSATPPTRVRALSKRQLNAKLTKLLAEKEQLQKDLDVANQKLKRLNAENLAQKVVIKSMKQQMDKKNKGEENLKKSTLALRREKFSYENLKVLSEKFHYLCGFSVEQFNIIFDVVTPYTNAINYPDCVGTGNRSLDKATELLSVLVICRHALHLGVMAYILNVAESTMYRIFVGWIVFLETIFEELELKPAQGFLLKKMPEIFIKTGHGLTDMVIDCTEFKLQHATNYELNSLMFSNYKNTVTGKALIGISPHGSGLLFSDIYPGSISDSAITEQSGVLDWIENCHEIMADRGFSIQDYCSIKGVYLNRPAQKDNDQFSDAEVAANFDIASTRIHVERYIGRVRDWSILNAVWPLPRMDLLSSTWQALCHLVNLTMKPIGPKENH